MQSVEGAVTTDHVEKAPAKAKCSTARVKTTKKSADRLIVYHSVEITSLTEAMQCLQTWPRMNTSLYRDAFGKYVLQAPMHPIHTKTDSYKNYFNELGRFHHKLMKQKSDMDMKRANYWSDLEDQLSHWAFLHLAFSDPASGEGVWKAHANSILNPSSYTNTYSRFKVKEAQKMKTRIHTIGLDEIAIFSNKHSTNHTVFNRNILDLHRNELAKMKTAFCCFVDILPHTTVSSGGKMKINRAKIMFDLYLPVMTSKMKHVASVFTAKETVARDTTWNEKMALYRPRKYAPIYSFFEKRDFLNALLAEKGAVYQQSFDAERVHVLNTLYQQIGGGKDVHAVIRRHFDDNLINMLLRRFDTRFDELQVSTDMHFPISKAFDLIALSRYKTEGRKAPEIIALAAEEFTVLRDLDWSSPKMNEFVNTGTVQLARWAKKGTKALDYANNTAKKQGASVVIDDAMR